MSRELDPKPQVLTPARVALGLTGPAIPLREQLRFQLDHALARDAVHAALDVPLLLRGLSALGHEALWLRSAADDRRTYLRRPDLGRQLGAESRGALQDRIGADGYDAVFVIADGLSALAVERHALAVVEATESALRQDNLTFGPVCLVTNGRVAIGDAIGEALGAKLTVTLIGERPGLSSPDSLGAYITWNPRPGRADSERNCISNIRTEGLSYGEAGYRIAYYVREARRLRTTGIALKDPPGRGSLGPI